MSLERSILVYCTDIEYAILLLNKRQLGELLLKELLFICDQIIHSEPTVYTPAYIIFIMELCENICILKHSIVVIHLHMLYSFHSTAIK